MSAPELSAEEAAVVARFEAAAAAPESYRPDGHGDVLGALSRLEELHAAATPGPWDAEICEGELTVSAGSARTEWTEHDGFRLGQPASHYQSTDRIYEQELDDWDGDKTLDDKQREADADWIVAAHNALPQLVAAVRAAYGLAEQLDAEAEHCDVRASSYPPSGPWAIEHHQISARAQASRRSAERLRAALDEALGGIR